MSIDNNYLSQKWPGFRMVWWLVTITLIVALFLLWVMGYGPDGTSCDDTVGAPALSASSDIKAPIISINENVIVNLVAGEKYTELGAKAVDEIDGNLSVITTGEVDTNTVGEYEITYSVTDSDGNTATEIRKVIVSPFIDAEVPEIILVGEEVLNIKVDSLYVDDGAIATDIPDGELKVVTKGKVNSNKVGEYLIKYTATDMAGNTTTKSRKVIVSEPDNDAPFLIITGEEEVQLTIGDSYKDAGATAVDISDGKLDVTVTGEVDPTTAGEYFIKYNVTDIAGNKAEKVRKIIVSEPDSLPPVITLKGDETISVMIGEAYEDPGARAEDSIDGVVDVLTSGKVLTDFVGDYTIIYTAKDSSGNLAEEKRLVVVENKDEDAPVIKLVGNSQVNMNTGDSYIDPGVKAEDAIDGEVEVNISGVVLVDTAGEYIVVYSASDKAGNTSEVKRTVIVEVADESAPEITLNGESLIKLKTGEAYEEAGATAVDSIDGDLPVSIAGNVNADATGEYIIVYSVVDKAGNTAETKRTVIIEASDEKAPHLTLNGGNSLKLKVGQEYEEAGAKATDTIDGEIEVTISGEVDTQKAGTYIVTYSAADKSGNSTEETRQVIVEEQAEVDSVVTKAKLYFEHNKSNNPLSNDGSFAKVINYLKNNASAKVNIYGFHDPSGDRNYNIGLANTRAETVSFIMIGAGIQSTRLTIKKPIETVGDGPSSEARRVEVDIKK